MKMAGGAAAGLKAAGGAAAGGAVAAGGGFKTGSSSSWSTSYGSKTGGYGRTIDEDEDKKEEMKKLSLSDVWSRKIVALKDKNADANFIPKIVTSGGIPGETVKIRRPAMTKKFVHLMEDLAGKLAVNKLNVAEEFVKNLKKKKEEEVYESIGVTRSLKSKSKNHSTKDTVKKHFIKKLIKNNTKKHHKRADKKSSVNLGTALWQ